MQKTILLTRYEFRPWVTRIFYLLFGASQSIQGIDRLSDNPLTTGKMLLGGFLLLTGVLLIFIGITLFTSMVRFSPKISVDENEIVVREDVFLKTRTIKWKDIKEISFKSFALDILLVNNTNEIITLRANAETSIEVKKLLREIAGRKLVSIKGG